MAFYLNHIFNLRFTQEERRRIIDCTNAERQGIFLLSTRDVLRYFGDSGHPVTGPAVRDDDWIIYDQYNDNRIAFDLDGTPQWWWLGTTNTQGTFAGISSDGIIRLRGTPQGFPYGGIRPALWLISDN
jgi:hypothetical protein